MDEEKLWGRGVGLEMMVMQKEESEQEEAFMSKGTEGENGHKEGEGRVRKQKSRREFREIS